MVKGRMQSSDFVEIIDRLGLSDAFDQYLTTIGNSFSSLARESPKINGGTFNSYEGSTDVSLQESHVTGYFHQLYKDMVNRCNNLDESVKRAVDYELVDHQTKSVAGSRSKPDAVFNNPRPDKDEWTRVHIIVEGKKLEKQAIEGKDLGQMAEYARMIWKSQPTRKFVPVILLNGAYITLLLFARRGCYYAEFGRFMHTGLFFDTEQRKEIERTFKWLWFLIIQRPEDFGHFVDVTKAHRYLKFTGGTSETNLSSASVDATVEIGRISDPEAVSIKENIRPNVNIVGRLGYLFATKFKGNSAVLKLSWTPTNRMPEAAVYEYLHQKKVVGVPQVFASGIIIRELFEYRLEFLLLENCGFDLNSYMESKCMTQSDKTFNKTVMNIVRQTFACLVQAKHHGVLHRDISTGNIAINEGKVSVIDWGYAKLTSADTGDTSHIDVLAMRWGYSKKEVQANEDGRDGNTGTPIYMGVRILSQCPQRGILDDLESMFYVVLHILCCKEYKGQVDFLGCRNMANHIAARLKIGAMSSRDFYLKAAGIELCSPELRTVLDKLHGRLFFDGDMFIGLNLIFQDDEVEHKRNLDDDFVRFFIGDAAFEKIFQRLPESPAVHIEAAPELPVNELTITDTFTASITLSRSTSTTRKRAMDDDSGDTTPKRQCQ
ncbi:hypothetical protein GGI05_002003 [Coemansia sp. RSA 2603]|nr:hypothetical protein GGI05_002003 [Coemansia sp. RSA 2603]